MEWIMELPIPSEVRRGEMVRERRNTPHVCHVTLAAVQITGFHLHHHTHSQSVGSSSLNLAHTSFFTCSRAEQSRAILAEMAMAPQEQQHQRPNSTTTTSSSSIATNRWGPYSGAGDFAGNMAVILAALLAALALALALNAVVRYLLRRARRRGRGGPAGEEIANNDADPEKPPPPPQAPPVLVYSASGTKLAGAAAECAICLAEFADGDAVRVMPACGHGFHARCIETWLAGGRRSSCPTCRAPAAAPPAQPPAEEASSSSI